MSVNVGRGVGELTRGKGALAELQHHGQSVWIDFLSRRLTRQGGLLELVAEGVAGVTSNPTIFQKALSEGGAYDDALRQLRGRTARDVFWRLAVEDVKDACDLLRPLWEDGRARGREQDGYVSLEVDPTLADDAAATVAQARRLHELVDRPNLYVKIPATVPGLRAIEQMIAEGRNINATLIFSLERYAAVVDAYLRGLERLLEQEGDLASVHSVASFFVSRVDQEADRRLEEAGHGELCGKLAIANAKLAYQHYVDVVGSERWQKLEEQGANRQWCLWASTSTKNPAYRDVLYVEELVGPETIDTMPKETTEAFQDHGRVRGDTLLEGVAEARQVFEQVKAAGVDYDDVAQVLEREGVAKFVDSFSELLAGLEAKQSQLA